MPIFNFITELSKAEQIIGQKTRGVGEEVGARGGEFKGEPRWHLNYLDFEIVQKSQFVSVCYFFFTGG